MSVSDPVACRSSSCSATTTPRAPGAPRRARRGAPRPRAGGHARRRPRDHLLGLLEHHAVAQSPGADRGAAGDRDRRDGRPTPGPERAIVNVHVPPFGSGLDEAPVLDANLTVQTAVGQVKFAPVGSTAVRDARSDPAPARTPRPHPRVGRDPPAGSTIAINPGSDYGTGVLNGALITLERERWRPTSSCAAERWPAPPGRGAHRGRRGHVRGSRGRLRSRRPAPARGATRLPDPVTARGLGRAGRPGLALGRGRRAGRPRRRLEAGGADDQATSGRSD